MYTNTLLISGELFPLPVTSITYTYIRHHIPAAALVVSGVSAVVISSVKVIYIILSLLCIYTFNYCIWHVNNICMHVHKCVDTRLVSYYE